MKTFSQRKNLKPAIETIQVDSMSSELLNSLWNALDTAIWSSNNFIYSQYREPDIMGFSRVLWFNFFKKPIDTRPQYASKILDVIRDYFFSCQWNEVYDFLEFIVDYYKEDRAKYILADYLNTILERELSAYRFVSGHLTDITNQQELEMLESVLSDSKFAGVSAHLQRALELYSSRDNPDYRNSIKESISSVEAMARIIAENPKATLGDALKVIEKRNLLHTSLKDGFVKLYGYTCDESGIRHAMLDEPKLSAPDAYYFLLSCTSFVNYLKSQIK